MNYVTNGSRLDAICDIANEGMQVHIGILAQRLGMDAAELLPDLYQLVQENRLRLASPFQAVLDANYSEAYYSREMHHAFLPNQTGNLELDGNGANGCNTHDYVAHFSTVNRGAAIDVVVIPRFEAVEDSE